MTRPKEHGGGRRTSAVVGFVLIAALLYFGREVLMPVALAVLLSFMLAPVVKRLERVRVPRALAVGVVVGACVVAVVSLGWLVERQVVDVATNVSTYRAEIAAKLEMLWPLERRAISKAGTALAEIGREITKPAPADAPTDGAVADPATHAKASAPGSSEPLPVRVVETPLAPLSAAGSVLGPVLGRLATALVTIVFTVFMLLKREDLRNRFIRLVGQREMHAITPALDEAAQRMSRYLLMQSATNAGVGIVVGVGLWMMGVPSASLWGLLAGLLRFVPYIGTWVAALLPAAVALATTTGWREPLLIIGFIGVVELITAQAIEPLLFRSGTGLSPLAILAASVFWAWLWGPVGLILALPLTVCLVVVGRHVPRLEFLEVLLGDEQALSPGARLYQRLLAEDPEEALQIVEAFAKGKSAQEVFDGAFLPALHLLEIDRHRGDLEDEREQAMREILETMVAEIGEPVKTNGVGGVGGKGSVEGPRVARGGLIMCVPVRDGADELAARMLEKLLTTAGRAAETLSAVSLASELIEQVATRNPGAVCVSGVPPESLVHTRVLCKRLRARFPLMPIVVGLWDEKRDAHSVRMRLGEIGTDYVATSLREAVEQLGALAGGEPAAAVRPTL